MNTELFSINGELNNSNVPEPEFKPFKLEVLDQQDSELGKHYKKESEGGPSTNEKYTVHFDSFSSQDPLLGEFSADNLSALERRRAVLALQDPTKLLGGIHFMNLKENPNDPDPKTEVAIYRPRDRNQVSEDLQKKLNFSTIVDAMNPRSSEPVVVVSKGVGEQSKKALSQAISLNLVTVAEDTDNHQFRTILNTDVLGLPGGVARKESVESELKAILNKSFNRDSRLPAGYKSTIEGNRFVVSKIDSNGDSGRLVFEMEQVSGSGNLLPPLKGVVLEYQGVAHKVDMDSPEQLQTVMGFVRPSRTIRKPSNVGASNSPDASRAVSSSTPASASVASNASRPSAASNGASGASGPATSSRAPASNPSTASTNGTASGAARATSTYSPQNGTAFNPVSNTLNGRQNGGPEKVEPTTGYNPRVTVDSTATVIEEPQEQVATPKPEIVNTEPSIMASEPVADPAATKMPEIIPSVENESKKSWFEYNPETKTVAFNNFRAFDAFLLDILPETNVVRAAILKIVQLSENHSTGESDYEVITTAVLNATGLTDSDRLKILSELNNQRLSVLKNIKT